MATMDVRTAPHAGVYLCTGRAISVLDLAAPVSRIGGRPMRVEQVAAGGGQVRASVGDAALARERLGFADRVSSGDGLRAMPIETASRHRPGSDARNEPAASALHAER